MVGMLGNARAIALTGSDQVVSANPSLFYGFTVRETAGSTAVLRFYDHASAASGTLLATVALAASESAREFYNTGVRAGNGVYLDVVSGSVEGSAYLG